MEYRFRVALGLQAVLLLILAVFAGPVAAAEPANPQLTALIDGVEDEGKRSADLRIETMEIVLRVHGGIAGRASPPASASWPEPA